MTELQSEFAEFKDAVTEMVAACGRAASAIIKIASSPMFTRAVEHKKIMDNATANECRMMHNKRKRIRQKYYNRVKRRIMT